MHKKKRKKWIISVAVYCIFLCNRTKYILVLFAIYLPPQELLNKAILASVAARREWDLKPVTDRAQIFFKAADVISGPKRAEILAKTMIGQVHSG